jgi:hypothetical protein
MASSATASAADSLSNADILKMMAFSATAPSTIISTTSSSSSSSSEGPPNNSRSATATRTFSPAQQQQQQPRHPPNQSTGTASATIISAGSSSSSSTAAHHYSNQPSQTLPTTPSSHDINTSPIIKQGYLTHHKHSYLPSSFLPKTSQSLQPKRTLFLCKPKTTQDILLIRDELAASERGKGVYLLDDAWKDTISGGAGVSGSGAGGGGGGSGSHSTKMKPEVEAFGHLAYAAVNG